MRLPLYILGIAVVLFAIGSRAEAQDYPWCAQYSAGRDGGGMNCGFVSFDQCMLTVRGMGGFCVANNRYHAPVAVSHPRHPARRHSPQGQS